MDRRALSTIFIIVFIDLLGFGLILPLLPYVAEQFNADPLQIGLLSAAYSLFQFISAPILGRLSDRYGRKKLLIISQIGSMAGFILLGVSHTLLLLFISRIIDGVTGGNISIAQAYIADVTDRKNRARGMGIIGAAFGMGFILGPAIGGFLSQWGFAVPAFFAAGISAITVITTALFLKETINVKKATYNPKTKISLTRFKQVMAMQPLGLLIIVFFLINLAFSGLQGTFALWTQDTFGWGPTQTGYLFAYIGILSVIAQLKILPALVNKLGERATLKMALPFLAGGLLLIPFSPHVAILMVANAMLVFGNALANPTIQAIASENVTQEEYGGTLGFLQSSASLGRIIGPALGGELYVLISKDAPYITSALILLPVIVLVHKYLPTRESSYPPSH